MMNYIPDHTNLIKHIMRVYGKNEDFSKFFNFIRPFINSELNLSEFLIPYPEEKKAFDEMYLKYKMDKNKHPIFDTRSDTKFLLEDFIGRAGRASRSTLASRYIIDHYGNYNSIPTWRNSGGYQWCKKNWGSNSGILGFNVYKVNSLNYNLKGTYCFHSERHSSKTILKLSKKFKKLEFNLEYRPNFTIIMLKIFNGKIIDRETKGFT